MVQTAEEPFIDAGEPWYERAACASHSPDIFFPETETPTASRAAKAICAGCPVRAECLAFAMETVQTDGVWGGMDAGERRRMRRRQRDRERRKAS